MNRYFLIAITILLLTSCASMNNAFTPSPRIVTDKYDGTQYVAQPEVAAGLQMFDHTASLRWTTKAPDRVYIVVGVNGLRSIDGVRFKLDDTEIIAQQSDYITDFDSSYQTGIQRSRKQYSIKLSELRLMLSSESLKLRISDIRNNYTVSNLGSPSGAVPLRLKLADFIALVDQLRAEN